MLRYPGGADKLGDRPITNPGQDLRGEYGGIRAFADPRVHLPLMCCVLSTANLAGMAPVRWIALLGA